MSLVVRRVADARQTRCAYLIGCARTGEAIVIDPPRDADRCIETAARDGLRIAAVADTQVHSDILSGTRELAERTGAQVLASAAGGPDATPHWVARYAHRLLRDGDSIDIGSVHIRVLHTPGCAPEALSFLIHEGGAHEGGAFDTDPCAAIVGALLESRAATDRILALPDWVQLWPLLPIRTRSGCLPQTTVGYERLHGVAGVQPSSPFSARIRATNLEGVPLLSRIPEPEALASLEARPDLLDPKIATIVDTRAWAVFRSGHLPGAIHAPLGRAVASTIAACVEPDERVVLVCDPGHTDELVRECVRAGIDRVEAIIAPALLHSHRQLLRTAPEVGAEAAALALRADDVQVIDVRTDAECARGTIPGALRMSGAELRSNARQFHRWKVIVHCAFGTNSATACSVLRRHGVDAVNLAGGFEAWRRSGQPVQGGALQHGAPQDGAPQDGVSLKHHALKADRGPNACPVRVPHRVPAHG